LFIPVLGVYLVWRVRTAGSSPNHSRIELSFLELVPEPDSKFIFLKNQNLELDFLFHLCVELKPKLELRFLGKKIS
jgi:hypothetical protein